MLNKQEIRQLTEKDLLHELTVASRELLKIKMDLEGGYAKGSHKAKELKKYIAQLLTVQKETARLELKNTVPQTPEIQKQAA